MSEPHRIYGWQHGQLSIAQHYGGAIINGKTYSIRYDIDGQPLEEVATKKRKKPKPPTKTAEDLFKKLIEEDKR
jgi:hypothetical protein